MKEVIAYKCSFCGKIYENKNSCRAHEYKCYFNQKTKSCASNAFNTISTARIMKDNSYIQFPSCLANVDVSKLGLQTICPKYLDRKCKNDQDIMQEVMSAYNPKITLDSYVEKHSDLFD